MYIYVYIYGAGTTKVKNIISNIESMGVKLSEENLKEIKDAVPIDEVGGYREMEMLSEYVWKFADTPPK